MTPKQEDRFEYKGYPCVVLFMPTGYRCGYVGIPKDTEIDVDSINCHGGITYKKTHLHCQEDTDRLWIGFDCAHIFDGYDVEKAKEVFADDEMILKHIAELEGMDYFAIYAECPVRTLEYCQEWCRKIVDQVTEINLR